MPIENNGKIDYIFKDAPPEETVKKIKGILKKTGIPACEDAYINNSDFLYSLRLSVEGFDYRVNGKAVTKQYALASAYAELMERLQNQLLWPYVEFSPNAQRKYGFRIDIHEKVYAKSDIPSLPEDFKSARIYSKKQNLYELWEYVKETLSKKSYPVVFIPYFNMRDDEVVYLPRTFIYNVIGSNGMAAGNTPEEALTQGLSEVLERYVLKVLYFQEITPPTIPKVYIKLHAPEQYDMIKKLEHTQQYKIIVKDCSLNMRLPVIATIIILIPKNMYVVSIGAYPIWQVALERCITEAFQGQQITNYRGAVSFNFATTSNQKMIYDNYMNIVRRSKGQYPASLLHDRFSYEFKGFPDITFKKHKEMLSYLVNLIRDFGYNMYFRDVSFLKFNAYQIIIPGMSVVKMLSKRNWKEAVTSIPVIDYLCNIHELSNMQLRELAEDMENYIADESRRSYFSFSRYVGLPIRNYTPWQMVTLHIILALIYCKLGEISYACKFMVEYTSLLNNLEKKNNAQLLYAFRDFLLLSLKYPKSPKRTRNILKQLYDEELVDKIFDAVQEGSNILKMLKIFFPDFKLPNCWNCKQCPVTDNCRYKELETIHLSLKKAIKENTIDQLSMRNIVL